MKILSFTVINRHSDKDELLFDPSKFDTEIKKSDEVESKYSNVYVHGEAQDIADYDIPVFFNGDMNQLLQPVDKQKIQMFIGNQVYSCKAVSSEEYNSFDNKACYLTLKKEKIEKFVTDEEYKEFKGEY
tara:strand:- start:241 stop:627 length:387 start_codon:yes stop_codon:yes gene_type:complete